MIPWRDTFGDDRAPGTVDGSGPGRRIADAEDTVSIDRGALRFAPNRVPGWGRQGVSYPPVPRHTGTAFAVMVLNGHNGSHSGPIDGGLRRRFDDWLRGPRGLSIGARLIAFARYGRRRESLRLMRWWLGRAPRFTSGPTLDDNLAVGFFHTERPDDPLRQGTVAVVRTNEGLTGMVVASHAGDETTAIPDMVNVPTGYITVLRERGAMLYATSQADVRHFAPLPFMRPIALDPGRDDEPDVVYAGVHQSVLGQVGFSADTRISDTAVARPDPWRAWCTTAIVADRLPEGRPIPLTTPERGPSWSSRTTVAPSQLVGLVAVRLSVDAVGSVRFRHIDEHNHWCVRVEGTTLRLSVTENGATTDLAHAEFRRAPDDLLQIVDDGHRIRVHIGASPAPFRGKPNHPGRVSLVARKLAEIRGESLEELAGATYANANRLFGLQ